jgi:predicted tellurium resistance membrane protein TerC
MRLNRGGLISMAVYFVYLIPLLALVAIAKDPKGGWFIAQLAILPAVLLLGLTGLIILMMKYVPVDSWLNSAYTLIPLSFLIMYLIGWSLSAFARKMKSVKPDPSMPVVDPPGWSDRDRK